MVAVTASTSMTMSGTALLEVGVNITASTDMVMTAVALTDVQEAFAGAIYTTTQFSGYLVVDADVADAPANVTIKNIPIVQILMPQPTIVNGKPT